MSEIQAPVQVPVQALIQDPLQAPGLDLVVDVAKPVVKRKVKPKATNLQPVPGESEPPQLLIDDDLVFELSKMDSLPKGAQQAITPPKPLTDKEKRHEIKERKKAIKHCEKQISKEKDSHPLYSYLYELKDSIETKETENQKKGVYKPWDSLVDAPANKSILKDAIGLAGTPSELKEIATQIKACEENKGELADLTAAVGVEPIYFGEFYNYLDVLLEFARVERIFRQLLKPFWSQGKVLIPTLKRQVANIQEDIVDLLHDRLREKPELEGKVKRTKQKLKAYNDLLESIFEVPDDEAQADAVGADLSTLLKEAMAKVLKSEPVDMNMFNPMLANMNSDEVLNVLRRVKKQGQKRSFFDQEFPAKKNIWKTWFNLVDNLRKMVELQMLEDEKADYDEEGDEVEQREWVPCDASDEASALYRVINQVAVEIRNGWRYDGVKAVRITAAGERDDAGPLNMLAQTLADMMAEIGPKATKVLSDKLVSCMDPVIDTNDQEQVDALQLSLDFVESQVEDLLKKARQRGEYQPDEDEDSSEDEEVSEDSSEVENVDALDVQRAREIVQSMASQFQDIKLSVKGLQELTPPQLKSHKRALNSLWDTYQQLNALFTNGKAPAAPGPEPKKANGSAAKKVHPVLSPTSPKFAPASPALAALPPNEDFSTDENEFEDVVQIPIQIPSQKRRTPKISADDGRPEEVVQVALDQTPSKKRKTPQISADDGPPGEVIIRDKYRIFNEIVRRIQGIQRDPKVKADKICDKVDGSCMWVKQLVDDFSNGG